MKLYDCFQFFNEFDILEIRLELLYDYVDHFVISETSRTHSNKEKPFYFDENKEKFSKYMDKIIHIKEDYPENILKFSKRQEDSDYNRQYNIISDIYDKEENEGDLKRWPNFCRDYLQREYLKLGLINCLDDDIIMVSDLDEIPDPEVVSKIKSDKLTNHCVLQDCYYYYINTMAHTNWYGNYIVLYEKTKNVSLTHLRNERASYIQIPNGGWHFSFMGGVDRVKQKIESYAHQEYNQSHLLNQVESNINQNRDIFGRGNNTYMDSSQKFYFDNMLLTDINKYPKKMIDIIKTKYQYLIK